ncbi:MAG: hypothetical protein ACC707_17775 [Thiohalomonadales bacterium]
MTLALGIIVALPAEASALSRHIPALARTVEISNNVNLIVSGIGIAPAERAANLLMDQGSNALLSFGTAVGISPICKAGDIIIAKTCLDSCNHSWPAHPHWHQTLYNLLSQHKSINVLTETLCESERLLNNRLEKEKIFASTGAIAVDMESAAIARMAHTHHLPFLSLRAIVDSLDRHIPAVVTNAMDKQGNVNTGKLLLGLFRQPTALMPLIQLAGSFYLAKKALVNCRKIAGLDFRVTA